MNSLTRLKKSTISIPEYRSISKRSISLPRHVLSKAMQPGSLVIVDATGLKVYGKDEWHPTGCGFFGMVEFVCPPRPGWVSKRQGEIG
jgi:hypothetical protein